MLDGRNFFDQPIGNDLKIYDNIRKTATGQGDNYTTGCLLDYPYFKKYYKLIATDLAKQPELDADPKAIQQILERAGGSTIIEEAKETILDFSKGAVKVL